MTRSRRNIVSVALILLGTSLLVRIAAWGGGAPAQTQRSFEFTCQVHVPADAGARAAHLWIPLPPSDAYQSIRDLRIESTVQHSEGHDAEYHNSFAMFTPTLAEAAAGYEVTLRFRVHRSEHAVDVRAASLTSSTGTPPASDSMLTRYLQPDRLVPLNDTIAQLAREQTVDDTTPMQKAHHIYDYVVATMRYDKSGEGWGRGDAVWACTSKRGNCTDFHSLFIGMMRAAGIPARFEIGFPIPEGKTEGDIPGYHCWAEFYLNGAGWIPVDASEAWKNPAKHDYFFGALDANRVFFTYGRDIVLSPAQKGPPLNYFIYPYAEADDHPVAGLTMHFSFREIAAAPTQAAAR